MTESAIISIRPCTTSEEKVMDAARSGDIGTLYQLIGEDVNVFKRMNKRRFFDTPLHIASAAGKTEFAMELMYLNPSFATKLNKDGLSPLHLALQEGKTDLALSLLTINKNLVSVKGKMGYTPIHYLAMKETDRNRLTKFLNACPECIHHVTSRDETALHVAASNNNIKALEVLLRWLRKTSNCSMLQKERVLNHPNRDGDTVLHVAVSNKPPDPEMVRLLTSFRIKMKATNSRGSTALDILKCCRTQEDNINIKKCVDILGHDQCLNACRKGLWYFLELLSQWGYEIKHMSNDRGNALLVVTVLILTATYQATLSPPGGVLSLDADTNNKNVSALQIYFDTKNTTRVETKANYTAGSSVLQTIPFLWFFIPNLVAFAISFLLTCFVLLTLVSGFFSFTLILSLSMLLFCLLVSAVMIISPNNQSSNILLFCVYIIVYVTYCAIAPVLIPKIRRMFR
ncbi:PREDICTED: alpha-latroinsectotoxin-Lt1a-like [Theobroma cacao]|uniref:Alpha-latroinsectotoxin-Lt1a n=1 Tax=Theobroma cacao TaxID=3641 RepID=A0AB32ULN9_THECC|nr:PREDICTED: alpha-latroinsectotoxin-Lt1a [Theobroma cacao]XP_017984859.1 PREDICTED: alpha-latroinsectotoxin-Lt1a-like [Theobroma cacao]